MFPLIDMDLSDLDWEVQFHEDQGHCGRLGNLISQKRNKKAEGYHDQLCS